MSNTRILCYLLLLALLLCSINPSFAQDESSTGDGSTGELPADTLSATSIPDSSSATESTAAAATGAFNQSSTGAFINCTLTPNITECLVNCTLTPFEPICIVNCTLTPLEPACLVNCTLFPDDPTCYTPVPLPPTSQQILANASCPIFNYRAAELLNGGNDWCIAGEIDHNHCDPAISPCSTIPEAQRAAQGIQQDSLYSTNPPDWWRCIYTKITYTDIPATNTTNSTTEITETPELVTIVPGECFSDPSQCGPLRYMSQLTVLNDTGGPMWLGQQLPPYNQFERPPISVIVSNAAYINMSLFYPYIDVLQLLQLQNSGNSTFFSLSVSTRIVVEFPGSVISNSRMRFAPTCGYVVPFYTLILSLSGGFPEKAEWEDDCSTCTERSFVYSDDGSCNCGVPIWACIGYSNTTGAAPGPAISDTNYLPNSIDCDLKVYLAYRGTDRDGNTLTSSSRTLKNFRKWSFGSLYNNIIDQYNNLPSVDNSFQACKKWLNDDPSSNMCLAY